MRKLLLALVFLLPFSAQAGMYQKIYGNTNGAADTTITFDQSFKEKVDFQVSSYADVFKDSVYTEQHVTSMFLNWVGVEAVGTIQTTQAERGLNGEDNVMFGLHVEPFKFFLPDYIKYHLTGYPGSIDGVSGYQAQIEHVYSVAYWKLLFRGFVDHNISSKDLAIENIKTQSVKSENELAFKINDLFSIIGEYRFNSVAENDHEFAFGMALSYF